MIILFLAQLLIGTLFLLSLYGKLLNGIQHRIKPKDIGKFLLLYVVISVILNSMIAYYYSTAVDMFADVHKGRTITAIFGFCLLTVMLTGAAKYSDSKDERNLIVFSGGIGITFYLLIRFVPAIGTNLFGWLPVYLWL